MGEANPAGLLSLPIADSRLLPVVQQPGMVKNRLSWDGGRFLALRHGRSGTWWQSI